MKRILVNGKYLTEPQYLGSGFHTYLQALIQSWAGEKHGSQNHYLILLPEDSFTSKAPMVHHLSQSSPRSSQSISFHPLPRKNHRFEDDLVDPEVLKHYHADHLFFPHLELPKKLPLPTTVVIHDIIPTLFLTPDYLLKGKTPLRMITCKGIADYFYLKRYLPHIQYLIAISQTTSKSILDVYGDKIKEKIRVIYPPLTPLDSLGKKFHSLHFLKQGDWGNKKTINNPSQILQKHGLLPKKFIIYFGGYTARKNYVRLIKAHTQAIQNYQTNYFHKEMIPLVMVGGKGRVTPSPYIHITSKLPEEELYELISKAVFSIYPSLFEGFGFPILESIILGTLPLMSDIPSSREIILQNIPHLFFNPYRSADIAKTILYYLTNSGEIETSYDTIKSQVKNFFLKNPSKEIDFLLHQ